MQAQNIPTVQSFTGRTVVLRSFKKNGSIYNLRELKKIPDSLNTKEINYSKILYLTKERKLFGIIPLPDIVLSSKIYYQTREWLKSQLEYYKIQNCELGFYKISAVYSKPKRIITNIKYPANKYSTPDIPKNGILK